jgi:hypothetical protein
MIKKGWIILFVLIGFQLSAQQTTYDGSLENYVYLGKISEGFYRYNTSGSVSIKLLKSAVLGEFKTSLHLSECREATERIPAVIERIDTVRSRLIRQGVSEFIADSLAKAEIINNWPYCKNFRSKQTDLIYWAGIQNINIVSTLDELDSDKLDQDFQYAIEFYRARWFNNESELIMQSVEAGMSPLINKSVYYPTINKVLGKLYYLSNQTSFEYLKELLSTNTRVITESHGSPNPIEPVILKDLQYYYPYLFKNTDKDKIKNAAYYLDELISRINRGEKFKSIEVVKFW